MRYLAEQALLPDRLARDVLVEIEGDHFVAITPDSDDRSAPRLPGVVLPGFANCHSHAFHRALRGRTHDGGGTFWTWREQMYAIAARLDPDSYLALARGVYAEMALSGITSVGEFHYLHHGPDGQRYDDPNAMAEALRQAAADAGVRLTLLDACYLHGGLDADGHLPLDGVQRRFGDDTAQAWAERVSQLRESAGMRVGAAVHSVRAVAREDLPVAAGFDLVHAHVSEQPAENEACLAYYGATPTELLAEAGLLAVAQSTAVHATHLTDRDVTLLRGATACVCPTTERDLADGIGPARRLADEGVRLSLGTDQNALIDFFEEGRGLEADERLASLRRGNFSPREQLAAMTAHASIGWPEAGTLAIGARADLVAVRLDTVRTAGCDPAQVVSAAGAPDVDTVVANGVEVVSGGRHRLGDIGGMLRRVIVELRGSD